ncbi:PilZ domain-containing protein [Thermoproteota archaeon]
MSTKCRRKSERLPLGVTASYRIPTNKKWMDSISVDDVSGGGLRLKTKKKIKDGSKINLKLNIPSQSKPISALARVIWCRKDPSSIKTKKSNYLIGIEFLKMNDKDRRVFVSCLCEEILFHYLTNEGKVKPEWI